MNGKERKTLEELSPVISRLDERSLNTLRLIDDIKKLLEKQNGRISRNSRLIFTILGMLMASGAGYGFVRWLG